MNKFLAQVAAALKASPESAPQIYSLAAARFRQAARNPKNATNVGRLLTAATQMEQLAAASVMPPRDFDGEIIHPYAPISHSSVPHDFDVLVGDMASAGIAEPEDEFGQIAQLQAIQQGREREIAPPVRITPESLRETTVLGNAQTVQYGGDSQEQPCVWWDGKENEAQTATITIGRIENGGGSEFPAPSQLSPALNYSYRPYARVRWGSRGYMHEAFVDVGRGTQLTVCASHIQVSVGMDAPRAGEVAGTMKLAATIGFFANYRQVPNTRTAYIDSLASGSLGGPVKIPPFAQTMMIYNGIEGTFASRTLECGVTDVEGNSLYGDRFTGAGMRDPVWLSNDAYNVYVIQTTSNSNATNVRIIFGLSL